MKNILISLLVLFSTILSAAPQSKSGQVGFYQATGVAGTNRFLWDRTNDWLLLTHGALVFGTNQPLVDAEIIRAVSDSTAGDPSARTLTMEANDTGSGAYGGALLNVNNAGDTSWILYNHKGLGFGLYFNPNEINGVTPFALNATVAHTSGSLLSISNFDVGKFDVAHNGMIWSATNRFAFATTTNVWPLTNAVAGQVLTSAGGAGAQMYWSTASGGSGPSFADLVWTNNAGVIEPVSTNAISIRPDGSVWINGTNDLTSIPGFAVIGTNTQEVGLDIISRLGGTNVSSIRVFSYADDSPFRSTHIKMEGGPNFQNTLIFTAEDDFVNIYGSVGTYGEVINLEPTAPAGTTAYTYDTSLAHTSGNLVEWKNLGVTQLSLSFSNGIATPAITAYGAGSAPWQFGMATNMVNVQLTATNVLEFVVNGVSYLVPASLK